MKCPNCKASLSGLSFSASYSEVVYGTASGTYDIEREAWDTEDHYCDGSDDYCEEDYSYECPECCASLEVEDLLENEEDKEEEVFEVANDKDNNIIVRCNEEELSQIKKFVKKCLIKYVELNNKEEFAIRIQNNKIIGRAYYSFYEKKYDKQNTLLVSDLKKFGISNIINRIKMYEKSNNS